MANCENCVKSDVCKYYEPKSTIACEHYSEPVRHGQWGEEDTAITCPICTRSYDTDFEIKRSVVLGFKYCPECGARMDGENNG